MGVVVGQELCGMAFRIVVLKYIAIQRLMLEIKRAIKDAFLFLNSIVYVCVCVSMPLAVGPSLIDR